MDITEIIENLKNPDKAPEAILQLSEVIADKEKQITALEEARKGDAQRIADLTETTGRLMLRITEGDEEADPEPEKTPEDYREELLKMIGDELNNGN